MSGVRRITRSSKVLAVGTQSLPSLPTPHLVPTPSALSLVPTEVSLESLENLNESFTTPKPKRKSTPKSTKSPKVKTDPTAPSPSPRKKAKLGPSATAPALPTRLIPQPGTVFLPLFLNFDLPTAISHLTTHDPRFHQLFKHLPCRPFVPPYTPIDPFRTLVTSIIGQQVSWMAARAINRRFRGLYGFEEEDHGGKEEKGGFPTPEMVSKSEVMTLKGVGLSTRKAEYVIALAQHFVDGHLSTELFRDGTDEEVSRALIAVRGIGQWTVDMFLIFSLRRPDVLPVGDLGVQKGLLRWALAAHDALPQKMKTPKKTPKKTVEVKVDPEGEGEIDTAATTTTTPSRGRASSPTQTAGKTTSTPQTPKPAVLHTPNGAMNPPQTPSTPFPTTPGDAESQALEVPDKALPPPAPAVFLQPPITDGWDCHRAAPMVEGLSVEVLKQRYNGKKVKGGAYLTPGEMEALTDGWRPYRSLGVIYTWSVAEDL